MFNPSRRRFLETAGAAALVGAAGPAQGTDAPRSERHPLRYRLGIVTYNIAASWDLPTILRVCRRVGLAAVELRTTHRHGVEPTLTREQRREVRQRFSDAGVLCWGCGTTCEFHSPDPVVVRRNIETCRRFLDLAADIGGRGVKVRPNDLPAGVPVERTLAQIGRALATCGQAAADRGLEIWLEVHGRGTAHPPHIRTIMQHCNHPRVGITWNSNNTDVVRGSVREYFRLLQPWLRSCHINELYSGYPYRELFHLLREADYDRVTLAEIPGTADVASGERLLRYYKALWTELTT
jgi:sugar phosphate isomerase/epimerase